jgi:hypothetical protein
METTMGKMMDEVSFITAHATTTPINNKTANIIRQNRVSLFILFPLL